jgi:hypothetical protein
MVLALPAAVEAQYNYTNTNGTVTITAYTGPGGAVTIPSEINGYPVASLTTYAFWFSTGPMTSVTIPSSVTNIEDETFGACFLLTTITVDTNNPAYSSADGVLFNKSQTTLVEYPTVKAGSSYMIPDSVSSIEYGAFLFCNNLTNVTIPDSVIAIGDSAFSACNNLVTVTLPNGITNIGNSAFDLCEHLASVTIPNSVTSIGGGAFGSCWSLTDITIGNGVTSMGEDAFNYCSNLTSVYFQGNAPAADSSPSLILFYGDSHATVYYLPGTTGWGSTFGSRPTVLWNPQIQPGSVGVKSNQFGFNITGSGNLVIVIEASTNLANPTWSPLQTNTLNGSSLYFTDPSGPTMAVGSIA